MNSAKAISLITITIVIMIIHILVDELVIDGLLNKEPASGDTVLPLVEEHAAEGVLHCLQLMMMMLLVVTIMMTVLMMAM